ncbi:hypothetical protein BKA83DRAFT_4260462, partial [Pisolithus microcarpus]
MADSIYPDVPRLHAFCQGTETLRSHAPVLLNVRTSTEAVVWHGVNGGLPIYIPPIH